MASVSYNSYTLSPTPFVSKAQRSSINGSHVYPITDFKLNGFVTGDVSGQSLAILTAFTGDFKTFSVVGDNINDSDYLCSIKGVTFSPTRSTGVSNYSIDLECYKSSDFQDFGIKDPINE